jgi:hypothetical protein
VRPVPEGAGVKVRTELSIEAMQDVRLNAAVTSALASYARTSVS